MTEAAIAEANGEATGRPPSQADALLGLAADLELFHTADGTGYADLTLNGHRETWALRSKGFRRWLTRRFYEAATAGAPSTEAMQAALNAIEARAQFDAAQGQVHLQVAEHDGKLYLDLADEAWRAVEIDPTGWRLVDEPPVRFRRSAGMLPLPEPARGLGRLPNTRMKILPRMADFALWASACETRFWPEGSFEAAYARNRDDAVDNVLEADPVGEAIRALMAGRGASGSAHRAVSAYPVHKETGPGQRVAVVQHRSSYCRSASHSGTFNAYDVPVGTCARQPGTRLTGRRVRVANRMSPPASVIAV